MTGKTNFAGPERREQARWTFKKEISLADILSFISAACAVIYAYTTLDKRVAFLEQVTSTQRETDRRQDEESVRGQARIEVQYSSLAAKVDRILERVR